MGELGWSLPNWFPEIGGMFPSIKKCPKHAGFGIIGKTYLRKLTPPHPPKKLIWQWKINIFYRRYILYKYSNAWFFIVMFVFQGVVV